MKINLLNYQPNRIGGGWTQARYLFNGLGGSSYDEADIVLITGATMASYDDVEKAKKDGKKVVLRVDNIVRNSRNRNSGMPRMKRFAELADLVIYQSEWAKKLLMPMLEKGGVVILNGVDTNRFNPNNRAENDSYLYVRSSRDEGKQWIMAWYWFIENVGKNGHLDIVGKFSPDNLDYNFDFSNGERYTFYGEQSSLADIYRNNKYFLYTYLNDACSNTLLEARASGCEIVDVYGMLQTGGAPEIMACQDISIERMIKEYQTELGKL